MPVLSIIAFVTGVLGVWLTIKQNIWCWPMALISTVAATIDFFTSRLFGDMSLQIFYFFAGIYGWIYWNREQKTGFEVTKMPLRFMPVIIVATIIQAVVYYKLLIHFNGARPMLDAVLTAASLTTTFMMTKKWVENWLIWVFIDGTYILLYALTDLWMYGALYLFFAVMALFGWLKWRKEVLLRSVL